MTALAEPVFIEPSYTHKPPRYDSLLPKVDKICRLLGEELEPEQAYAIDVLTGRKADGTPASLSGAVICARQNLKTFILERIVLTLMLEPRSDIKLLLWTSQQLDTCDETFDRFVGWFEGVDDATGRPKYPAIAKRLKVIDHGKGTKQVKTIDGKRLKFKARSPKSGQGLSGDVVVFDEAFAVVSEHTAALVPTLSTRRRAQIYYGSSAGHEDSAVLRSVRDRGRKGGPGAPAYLEWCAPGSFDDPGCEDPGCLHLLGVKGCSLDRQDLIQLANPMAGRRITWEYLTAERQEFAGSPDRFARERLGWWDNPLDELQPISVEAWNDLAETLPLSGDSQPCFFIDCSPNLKSASIAGASLEAVPATRLGGPAMNMMPHVRMAEYRSGTHWLPAKIEELRAKYPQAKWQWEASSPFSALATYSEVFDHWTFGADEKQDWPGIIVEKPFTSNDMARGCGHMQNLVNDQRMTHSEDAVVTAALHSAVMRPMGDPGLWSWGRRRSSGDISPLVAVTGALWLLESQPATTFFFSKR